MGAVINYAAASRHKLFAGLVQAVLESRAVPAEILPRRSFRRLSEAFAEDIDAQPDIRVPGMWIDVSSTSSQARVGESIDQTARDARLTGSNDVPVFVTYRQNQNSADGLVVMRVDDFAKLVARMLHTEAAEQPEGVTT